MLIWVQLLVTMLQDNYFSENTSTLLTYCTPEDMPDRMNQSPEPMVTQGQFSMECFPDSKDHGANLGPTWGRQDPGWPQVGPMNFAIWVIMPVVEIDYTFKFTPLNPQRPESYTKQFHKNIERYTADTIVSWTKHVKKTKNKEMSIILCIK